MELVQLSYANAFRLLPGDRVLSEVPEAYLVKSVTKLPENIQVATKEGELFGYKNLFVDSAVVPDIKRRLRFRGSTEERIDCVVRRLGHHLKPYPTITSENMGSLLLDLDSISSDLSGLAERNYAQEIFDLSTGLYRLSSNLLSTSKSLFQAKSVSTDMLVEALSYAEGFTEITSLIGRFVVDELGDRATELSRLSRQCRLRVGCVSREELDDTRKKCERTAQRAFEGVVRANELLRKTALYTDVLAARDSFVDTAVKIGPLEIEREQGFYH